MTRQSMRLCARFEVCSSPTDAGARVTCVVAGLTSAVSSQQSATSSQQPAVSNQPSAVSSQQSVLSCPLVVVSCLLWGERAQSLSRSEWLTRPPSNLTQVMPLNMAASSALTSKKYTQDFCHGFIVSTQQAGLASGLAGKSAMIVAPPAAARRRPPPPAWTRRVSPS